MSATVEDDYEKIVLKRGNLHGESITTGSLAHRILKTIAKMVLTNSIILNFKYYDWESW